MIEDSAQALGGTYKRQPLGSIGDVGCFSVMSRKALAIGEGGIFITNDREIYERGVLFADQSRHDTLTIPELAAMKGLPVGGVKYRMHQLSSAVGRVQLRHYRERMQEIQRAMNYFWDLLADVPGIKAHRPPADSGSTMGGWYASRGLYRAGELAGLPLERFCEAVLAEGTLTRAGANDPLHLQPLYQTIDVFGDGQPKLLPTFRFACTYRPNVLPLMFRQLYQYGFSFEDRLTSAECDLYHGDMIEQGRGEILVVRN